MCVSLNHVGSIFKIVTLTPKIMTPISISPNYRMCIRKSVSLVLLQKQVATQPVPSLFFMTKHTLHWLFMRALSSPTFKHPAMLFSQPIWTECVPTLFRSTTSSHSGELRFLPPPLFVPHRASSPYSFALSLFDRVSRFLLTIVFFLFYL